MTSIRLPILLDSALQPLHTLEPLSLSIQQNLSTLSTAVMTLPPGNSIAVGQFVQLFTAQGSAGIFRVEQVERASTTRISLTHGLVTLADELFQTSQDTITLPAPELLSQLLRRQNRWQAGTVTLPEEQLVTCRGTSSLLEALMSLLEALPGYRLTFDQTTVPWTLHILPLPTDELCECRLTRNLHSLSIQTDRSALCTRLYLPGVEQPLESDTITQWGAVTRCLSTCDDLTPSELLARGQQYLEQHKHPLITVEMEAVELTRLTGSTLDSFRLGVSCRVCLPEETTFITQRITALSWSNVYAAPNLVRITLANQAKSAASLLSGLIVDATQVRRQVNRQWSALGSQKNLLIKADESISLLSRNIDLHAQDILSLRSGIGDNAVSITLANGRIDEQAKAIALKADNAALELSNGKITANANEISLHSKTITSLQAGVGDNAANITLANGRIDEQAKAIALKADNAALELANGKITANANEISLHSKIITSLQAGVGDNAASITLANGRIDEQAKAIALKADNAALELANGKITANAKEISLHSKTITSLQAGVGDNAASITLANGRIDEQAKAIALKADNAALELANGKITAQAQEIALKANKIDLDGYVTMKSFSAEVADMKSSFAEHFTTDLIDAGSITVEGSLHGAYMTAENLDVSDSITINGATAATQSWVSNNYIPKANLTTLASQQWVGANYATKASLDGYQLKTGLTTKTYTVVTNVDYNTGTTPAFYKGETMMSKGITYVKGITKTTQDIAVVVYA